MKPIAGIIGPLNQEKIVLLLTIILFAIFSIILPKFLEAGNILTLVRSVAVLGILSLGMLIVSVVLSPRHSRGRLADRPTAGDRRSGC